MTSYDDNTKENGEELQCKSSEDENSSPTVLDEHPTVVVVDPCQHESTMEELRSHNDLPKYIEKHRNNLSFPEKLMLCLFHVENESKKTGERFEDQCVGWALDGTALCIRDKEEFCENLMAPFLGKQKYDFMALKRNLYRWGFRKVELSWKEPDHACFVHPKFNRSDCNLVSTMNVAKSDCKKRIGDLGLDGEPARKRPPTKCDKVRAEASRLFAPTWSLDPMQWLSQQQTTAQPQNQAGINTLALLTLLGNAQPQKHPNLLPLVGLEPGQLVAILHLLQQSQQQTTTEPQNQAGINTSAMKGLLGNAQPQNQPKGLPAVTSPLQGLDPGQWAAILQQSQQQITTEPQNLAGINTSAMQGLLGNAKPQNQPNSLSSLASLLEALDYGQLVEIFQLFLQSQGHRPCLPTQPVTGNQQNHQSAIPSLQQGVNPEDSWQSRLSEPQLGPSPQNNNLGMSKEQSAPSDRSSGIAPAPDNNNREESPILAVLQHLSLANQKSTKRDDKGKKTRIY